MYKICQPRFFHFRVFKFIHFYYRIWENSFMDKKTSQYFYILSALAIALQTVLLFADIRQFPLSSHTVAKYYFVVEDHDFFRLAHIDEEGEPEFIDDGILFINHHIMKKLYL